MFNNNGRLTNEEINQFEEFKDLKEEEIELLVETLNQIGIVMYSAYNHINKEI